MKRCRNMDQSSSDRFVVFYILVPCGLVSIGAVAYLFRYVNNISDVQTIMGILMYPALVMLFLVLPMFLFESRKYQITETGIIVGGWLRKKRLYSWNQIHGIGIYAFHSNAAISGYSSVICIFLRPKPDYFNEIMLKAYFYVVFRMKSIVVIDFSHSVLDEVTSKYHGIIKDYRETQIRLGRAHWHK